MRRVLITGGAGFIGSHVAGELLAQGDAVRVLDVLDPQVHGAAAPRPARLARDVELRVADVRDLAALRAALVDVDTVLHLAAAVGVGQSMYRMEHYTSVNDLGTARLLEAAIDRHRERPLERLVVASSMSIYGEGLYRDAAGRPREVGPRPRARLERGAWEPCDEDGRPLEPLPTPEEKRPDPASVYALSKWAQERMCHLIGAAYGIPTVALRFFNVYGPGQSLANPYTGVMAIFASALRSGRPPLVFEDGGQRRDFVHVRDVARACRLALSAPEAAGLALNIGSARSCSILELAETMGKAFGADAPPRVLGRHRSGDVRHCFADVRRARAVLGFEAETPLDVGVAELIDWVEDQVAHDRSGEMLAELERRGLAR